MEKLRRSLKIFWTEHSDPILFYALAIGVIILVVQGLNALTIRNNRKKQNIVTNNTNVISVINVQEDKDNKELINKFVDYCKKGQIQNAYNILSEKCKKDLYPTLTNFKNEYYNKMFTNNYDIELEYSSENIYKIIFYESMLETGKIENRSAIAEDYYKIDTEILEDKLYINYSKEIK